MVQRPDIVVRSSRGVPSLAVEVKRKTGATPEWARVLRTNLLTHGVLSPAEYFMLALPDRLYLWTEKAAMDALPNLSAPTADVLKSYLGSWQADELTKGSLELVVTSWLNDLTQSRFSVDDVPDALRWVVDSGLHAAIEGGVVELPAPV